MIKGRFTGRFALIFGSEAPNSMAQKLKRHHEPDYTFLVMVGVILVFGLIMLSSASTVVGFQRFDDPNYFLKHQLFYGVTIGLVAFFVTSKLPYGVWRKYAVPLAAITIIMLIMVLIPGIGVDVLGAQRWIGFGGLTFQPSELAKLAFILFLAAWLEKRTDKDLEQAGLLPFVALLGVIGVLIMLQPDLGTMTVIGAVAIMVYFTAEAPWKHFAWILFGSAGLLALLIKIAPYRAARLSVFLNPEMDPLGVGYHINQALLALGSGGLFGLGLGHSRQKYNYLPEVSGDSIFAVIGEELGFILAAAVVLLFAALVLRGLKIARKAPDKFAKYVVVGVISWVGFQAFVNIGAMLSLVPLTGITLPLVSYGSSSVITILAGLGIVVNISKHTSV